MYALEFHHLWVCLFFVSTAENVVCRSNSNTNNFFDNKFNMAFIQTHKF